MAKIRLERAWLWGGMIFGPGVVDLPPELVAQLQRRGVLVPPPPPDATVERTNDADAAPAPEDELPPPTKRRKEAP